MSKFLERTALRLPFVALCTNEKQYVEFIKKNGMLTLEPFLRDSHLAATHHFANDNHQQSCVVCIAMDKKRPWYETASVIAHEAVHIKQYVLEGIGEKSPGDEIEAYIVENTTAYLLKEYDRQMKGGK